MNFTTDVGGKYVVFTQEHPAADGEYTVVTRGGKRCQAWYIGRKQAFMELDGSVGVDAYSWQRREIPGPSGSARKISAITILLDSEGSVADIVFRFADSWDPKEEFTLQEFGPGSPTRTKLEGITDRIMALTEIPCPECDNPSEDAQAMIGPSRSRCEICNNKRTVNGLS